MKRMIAGLLVTAGIFGVAAPAMASTAVSIGAVNLRTGPGTDYTISRVMQDGQSASVLSHDGQWLKVKTADGTVGYMADWVTRELFSDENVSLTVNTDILNLRDSAGLDSNVIGQLKQGQQLHLLEGLGGWYKVDAGALGIGWVSAEWTVRTTPPAPAPQPVPAPTPQPAPAPAPQPVPAPPPATQPGPITPPPVVSTPQPVLTKTVTATSWTTIFTGRSSDYDPVANVTKGEVLRYLDAAEGWVRVADPSGNVGWVDGTKLRLQDDGVPFAIQPVYGMQENNWSIAYAGIRQVVWNAHLAVHTTPDPTSPVIRTLDPGNLMRLLQVPPTQFVQIQLANGDVGWVDRMSLRPVPDALPTESVSLKETSNGVLQLTVNGQLSQAGLAANDSTLQVGLAPNSDRHAAMAVNEYGVTGLSFDPSSMVVRFNEPFHYQVLVQSPTQTVIQIQPVVQKVESIAGADRQTYRFRMVGDIQPVAASNGQVITLNLPGSALAASDIPTGVTVQQTAAGVTATVASTHAYAIKRGAGYIDLVVYAPGLAGKTIVVDPGHGGWDPGAGGPTGLHEADSNLGIALKLQQLLTAAGARVIMTRTDDTACTGPQSTRPGLDMVHKDLDCRAQLANSNSADAYISVHGNASGDPSDSGLETYWSDSNLNASQSQALASSVEGTLVQTLGLVKRGTDDQPFYVIKYTDAPALLAEVGFVTNPKEESLLKQDSFRLKAAQAILQGFQQYFH